jgi:hypothetical protein
VREIPLELVSREETLAGSEVETARLATRTFTNEGTVTLTVCVRLADPRD